MAIKLDIQGQDQLISAIKKYGAKAIDRIEEAVQVTALDIEADAVKSIQRGSKTGRTYKKSSPNRLHRASAPGEAPASDTGRLAGSIDSVKLTPLSYEVGTLLKYGEWLEFGTTKIAERPWLRPSVQRARSEFFRRLKIALRR